MDKKRIKRIWVPIILLLIGLIKLSEACGEEIRFGILSHDVGANLKQRYEKGFNVNLEYLFNNKHRFFLATPHLGASINARGYTNSLYTGLTWHFDFSEKIFIEASFGGAIHNGNLKTSLKKRALGSRLLFRESFSVGVQANEKQAISVMIDHMSNAGLVKPNPGFTDIGIRYGYKI
jgi:hypothetical protein